MSGQEQADPYGAGLTDATSVRRLTQVWDPRLGGLARVSRPLESASARRGGQNTASLSSASKLARRPVLGMQK